jgi:AcrR family transcriptional regulator
MAVRPERVPAEQVRQRMLDAGRELALESGAALTIEHLRLEEIIHRARVPRSSVYRMWPYKEDYIDDLLSYLAGPGSWFNDSAVFDPGTFAVVERVIAENKHLLMTLPGRRALLREVLRLAVARNYQALSESPAWRLHTALVTTLGSSRNSTAREKIVAALEEGQSQSRGSMVALFGHLAGVLGMRLRDPQRSVEHMMLAGGLLVQSLALRNVQVQAIAGTTDGSKVEQLLNVPMPGPGLDGEPAEWSLAAFAYLGIVDAFAEFDPDFEPDFGTAPLILLTAGAGEFHHAVAEHRDAGQRFGLEVPRLPLAQQPLAVLAPVEPAVPENLRQHRVGVPRVCRRHPAQRQRRDRVLTQVGAQHVRVVAVGRERRVGEQRPQHPVLGHHHEPVGLVVDDPDRVELEEPFGHHERGLAAV